MKYRLMAFNAANWSNGINVFGKQPQDITLFPLNVKFYVIILQELSPGGDIVSTKVIVYDKEEQTDQWVNLK